MRHTAGSFFVTWSRLTTQFNRGQTPSSCRGGGDACDTPLPAGTGTGICRTRVYQTTTRSESVGCTLVQICDIYKDLMASCFEGTRVREGGGKEEGGREGGGGREVGKEEGGREERRREVVGPFSVSFGLTLTLES